MKMNSKSRSIVTALVAVLLTNALTMSVVSAVLSSEYYRGLTNRNVRSIEVVEKARRRAVREQRQYWDAVDVYHELQIMGVTNLPDPDIGVRSSYEPYLDPAYVEALIESSHGAADEYTGLTYEDLLREDQDLMDGFMLTGRCPESLRRPRFLPGFYELCEVMLDKKIKMEAEFKINRNTVKTYTNLDVVKKRVDQMNEYFDRDALQTEDNRRPSLRGIDRMKIEEENAEPYRTY